MQQNHTQRNVFGTPLQPCNNNPKTGFMRDGCCQSSFLDNGKHTVCAIMTEEFLQFSIKHGNDLITPRPDWDFPGLLPGDRWCVCAERYKEALDAGIKTPLVLEATNERTLDVISLEELLDLGIAPTILK
jgi:uncharacterized protein